MRDYNAISYYEQREQRLRELADAAEDMAISSGYREMADRYSAILDSLAVADRAKGDACRRATTSPIQGGSA